MPTVSGFIGVLLVKQAACRNNMARRSRALHPRRRARHGEDAHNM